MRTSRIRFDVTLLAGPRGTVMHWMICLVSIEGGERLVGQLFDRCTTTASQVEHLPVRGWISNSAHPGVDHVIDIDEVARLFTVTEDGEGLIAQDIAKENAKNALVRIIQRLPRTVD